MRLVLLILGILVAGCIAPPDGDDGARPMSNDGEMSAKESTEDKAALCQGGIGLPTGGQFCAERTIRVDGTIAGVGRMDVDLETFNGQVELLASDEGEWALTAVLKARGASEAEARSNLDRIQFAWSHTDGSGHFLSATAQSPPGGGNYAASLSVALPRSITLTVAASTSNGQVLVKDVRTDGLSAVTSNGQVTVDAKVTQADLRTSNGQIEAQLDPVGSGRITATTSNGQIELVLPEDARHGYDLDAQTSNGKVTINLRDGETTRKGPSNPYYDPQNDARFTTNGYASREIQSLVKLTTSNGAITVDPR